MSVQTQAAGPVSALAEPAPAVEFAAVVKDFGRVRALDGLDLAVPPGSITVILGPSGAGKTVTIKHIVGLLHPTQGTVRVDGRDLARVNEAQLRALRQQMSVQFQGSLPYSCALFDSLSVYDNVAFGLRHRTALPDEEIDDIVRDYLQRVGLAAYADHLPAQLSAGMRKRAALARALSLESRLVIIDDFESGIDGVRLAHLAELVRDVKKRTEATFVVTTHDIDTARRISDYAVVIHEGRVVASGPTASVIASEDPIVRQLMHGERTGPLALRSSGPDRREEYMKLYGKQYGMRAVPLAAVVLLGMFAAVLFLLATRHLG